MADMVVACLLWHDIAWYDAPDVLRNLAMDFSSIELLPSPALPKSAVDSHGKRRCQVTRLLQCTCIIVITCHNNLSNMLHCDTLIDALHLIPSNICARWSDSMLDAFLGLQFFICLLLFGKLLLCPHHFNLAPHANIQTWPELLVKLSLPGFGTLNRTK